MWRWESHDSLKPLLRNDMVLMVLQNTINNTTKRIRLGHLDVLSVSFQHFPATQHRSSIMQMVNCRQNTLLGCNLELAD